MAELTPEERQARNEAFQVFQRELGTRVSNRKNTQLIADFLDKKEGSEPAIRSAFTRFPPSVRDKALSLLDRYIGPINSVKKTDPWDEAARQNVFLRPDEVSTVRLDPREDARLIDWLGIQDKNQQLDQLLGEEFAQGGGYQGYVNPWRTGGRKINVLEQERVDAPGPFYEELRRSGLTPGELQAVENYIFNENVRTKQGSFKKDIVKRIDSAIDKADKAQSWTSFPERDVPLYRGEALYGDQPSPEISQIYEKNRPTSFSPGFQAVHQFAGGLVRSPETKGQQARRVIYAVTDYGDDVRPKLLVPGYETEIIAPSASRFEVIDKGFLRASPFIETPNDTEIIKLKQLYGVNPATAAVRGATEAISKNPAGVAGGAAMALLNDKVAEAIAKDDYKTAATEAAKDVALGAAAETGLRQVAAPIAKRVAPAAAARVAPYVAGAARVGIPAAVGTGLFMQGKTGSALDTLTNKAATVVPGLKSDPQTDVGRRAGKAISNEAKYLLNSVLQNRVPYLGGRLF